MIRINTLGGGADALGCQRVRENNIYQYVHGNKCFINHLLKRHVGILQILQIAASGREVQAKCVIITPNA